MSILVRNCFFTRSFSRKRIASTSLPLHFPHPLAYTQSRHCHKKHNTVKRIPSFRLLFFPLDLSQLLLGRGGKGIINLCFCRGLYTTGPGHVQLALSRITLRGVEDDQHLQASESQLIENRMKGALEAAQAEKSGWSVRNRVSKRSQRMRTPLFHKTCAHTHTQKTRTSTMCTSSEWHTIGAG